MKKYVSVMMALAVLVGVLSVGAVLPAVAEGGVTVTGGTMTAVTKASQLPKADNLLTGITPTWGSTGQVIGTGLLEGDLTALSDGIVQGFDTIAAEEDQANAAARIVCSNGTWTQAQNTWKQKVFLTYDLGAEKTMNTVVIAHSIIGQLADNPTTSFQYKGGVIITNDLTGFDSSNAANSYDWADLSFADTQENYAVSSVGYVNTAPIVKFTLDQEQTGRYVVINLEVADGGNFYPGTKLNSVYLSEVGVYNVVAPTVSGAAMTEVASKRDLPRGTNLLKGLTPYIGKTDTLYSATSKNLYQGDAPAVVTDGKVQGVDVISTAEDRYTAAARFAGANGAWSGAGLDWKRHVYLTFDLGESKTMDTVLVSHSAVGALADVKKTDYAYKLGVYISDDKATCETPANAVATVAATAETDLTANNAGGVYTAPTVLLKLDEAKTGRYVTVYFHICGADSAAVANPLNNNTKTFWAGISELGVYNTAVTVTGGTVTDVQGSHQLPVQDNLLAGLTPFWGNASGGKVSIVSGEKAYLEGTPKALTDGKVQGLTTWTEAAGAANSALRVAANNGAHNIENYDRWRTQVWISFDMGQKTAVDSVLIAHSILGDMGNESYTPNGKRAVSVEVRVTDTVAELATATPVLTVTPEDAANMADVLVAQLDKTVVGRYVGFFLNVPGSNTDYFLTDKEEKANYVYLSELGVYGTPVPLMNSAGAQLRNPEADTDYALRFVFDAAVTGAEYVDGGYAGDLTEATVLVGGADCKVKAMGAVVSIVEPNGALTLESADGVGAKDVPAVNLYAVDTEKVTYTAVVTGIPAEQMETALYAVPYIVYETAEGDVTLYGEMLTRTVADVLDAAGIL